MKDWLNYKKQLLLLITLNTGNKGEEDVKESIQKAVQVDSTEILVENKSLQKEKLTLPQ